VVANRVEIQPDLLRWARERAGLTVDVLLQRFPRLRAWEEGSASPTIKQLEHFANATHTPVGFLFLKQRPEESVPIPDYRTVRDAVVHRPSPDLLDMIYICQQRQDWYRDHLRSASHETLQFVGSARVADDVIDSAARIRHAVGLDLEERGRLPTWTDALRRLIDQVDALGVLVMVSGVVGSNTRRKLSPQEFRGFALVDQLAPLIFINGADSKAAQMFTIAHELAHVFLGQSAVSDSQALEVPTHLTEGWCNRVAAELLVPLEDVRKEHKRDAELAIEVSRLARRYKVSTLVVLRRLYDAERIERDVFREAYADELDRIREATSKGSGGNFYLTLGARSSKRFARALVGSALEGHTPFTEAFRLLGFKKMSTFNEVARTLGVRG